MEGRTKHNIRSLILPALLTAALVLLSALPFDFYYDLNDDFMMAHLLDGTYTGSAELYNIQSLFPLTAILGGLYHLFCAIPWYGIFLLICQFGGIFLLLCRVEKRTRDHLVTVLSALLCAALLYVHLIFVQYSVTVGILVAVCITWFLTLEKDEIASIRSLLSSCIVPLVLLSLAFCLRTEMTLFCLPFAALAFAGRVVMLSDGHRVKMLLSRGFSFLLVLLLCFGVLTGIDRAATASSSWKSFRAFFDARTQLYDFEQIPPYEGNEAFYDANGITKEQVMLLQNYNFALDDSIDADLVQKVADYAATLQKPVKERLSTAVWVFFHQVILAKDQLPWNLISIVLYGMVLIDTYRRLMTGLMQSGALTGAHPEKKKEITGRAAGTFLYVFLLLCIRSGLYLYLLYNNRPVERLTHCIYLLESLMLFFVLFSREEGTEATKGTNDAALRMAMQLMRGLVAACCIGVFALSLVFQVKDAKEEAAARTEANAPYEELLSAAEAHPDTLYVTDVYSTVDFSEKIFDNEKNHVCSWDLAGGWVVKSPLQEKKLSLFQMTDLESGLTGGNALFVIKKGGDVSFLSDYYASKGESITCTKTADSGSMTYFDLYEVTLK